MQVVESGPGHPEADGEPGWYETGWTGARPGVGERKELMELEKTVIPEGLRYSRGHVWAAFENGLCVLGWTDYIQQNAGDVNYVELPEPGKRVEKDQEFGTIETSKWVDRLYSPIAGEVVASNREVLQRPELINQAPFGEGWLVKLRVDTAVESPTLLSPDEYAAYVQTCEER